MRGLTMQDHVACDGYCQALIDAGCDPRVANIIGHAMDDVTMTVATAFAEVAKQWSEDIKEP